MPVLNVLICALFTVSWFWKAGYPPVADEVDFVKPLLIWITDVPKPYGVWHAPFYPWFLMVVGKIFGPNPIFARSIGYVSILATGFVCVRVAKILKPSISKARLSFLLALILFAPIMFSASLLLDYDNTLLVLSTALFIWAIVNASSAPKPSLKNNLGLFSILLGLCLMSKETTPLCYPIAILMAFYKREGVLKASIYSFLVLILGCAFFAGTTWIWCEAYNIPFQKVFEMDVLGFTNHSGSIAISLERRIWIATSPVLWLSLPLTVLFFANIHKYLRKSHPSVLGIFSIIFCVVFTYTFILRQMTYHFPKYMVPIFPWMFVLPFISVPQASSKNHEKALALFAIFGFLWFLLVPSPLRLLYARDTTALIQLAWVLLLPLSCILLIPKLRKVKYECLFIVILFHGVPHIRQSYATPRSITYWYGDGVLKTSRNFVQQWARVHMPEYLILSPAKDIAFELRDLGADYIPKPLLIEQAKALCTEKKPVLILTRLREDASLEKDKELAVFKKCFSVITDEDMVYGTNRKLVNKSEK